MFLECAGPNSIWSYPEVFDICIYRFTVQQQEDGSHQGIYFAFVSNNHCKLIKEIKLRLVLSEKILQFFI